MGEQRNISSVGIVNFGRSRGSTGVWRIARFRVLLQRATAAHPCAACAIPPRYRVFRRFQVVASLLLPSPSGRGAWGEGRDLSPRWPTGPLPTPAPRPARVHGTRAFGGMRASGAQTCRLTPVEEGLRARSPDTRSASGSRKARGGKLLLRGSNATSTARWDGRLRTEPRQHGGMAHRAVPRPAPTRERRPSMACLRHTPALPRLSALLGRSFVLCTPLPPGEGPGVRVGWPAAPERLPSRHLPLRAPARHGARAFAGLRASGARPCRSPSGRGTQSA